jgi:hypothetical protein
VTFPDGITRIGDRAFRNCSALAGALNLPASLSSIGCDAFDSCFGLTSVTFPDGLTTIDTEAFHNCYGLTGELILPASFTSIGIAAFHDCYGLTSVTFLGGLTHIANWAFAGCAALNTVTIQTSVPPNLGDNAFLGVPSSCVLLVPVGAEDDYEASAWNAFFSDDNITDGTSLTDGTSFSAGGLDYAIINGTTLTVTGFTNGVATASLSIPASVYYGGVYYPVTAIAGEAFDGISVLTSVTLPNSISSIGNSAFANCTALSSVTLRPYTPPDLDASAFDGIPTTCTFSCPVAFLDDYRNNPQWNTFFPIPYPFTFTLDAAGNVTVTGPVAPKATVTQMDIPQTVFFRGADHPVTAIAPSAFAGCTSLASFTLQSPTPPGLGAGAFDGIPATCAFSCPTAARNAYLQSTAWYPYFVTYDFKFSVSNGAASVTGPADGVTLTSLDLPASVYYGGALVAITAVGANAFSGHTSLSSITLPSSISSIGASAFAGCTALASVTLQSPTPPTLGDGAFEAVPDGCAFSCPGTALDAYRNNPQWNTFFPIPYPFSFTVDAGGNVTVTGPAAPKETVTQMDIPLNIFYRGTDHTITAIAPSAFAGCTALSSVTLQSGTPPALGDNAFDGVPAGCAFSCPGTALDAYRNHPQWNTFFPIPYPFNFSLDASGNVTVTGAVAPKATVTQMAIPQTIFYRGADHTITAIGASAFAN